MRCNQQRSEPKAIPTKPEERTSSEKAAPCGVKDKLLRNVFHGAQIAGEVISCKNFDQLYLLVLFGQATKQSGLLKSNLARHDDAKCEEDCRDEGEEWPGAPKRNKSRYEDNDPEGANGEKINMGSESNVSEQGQLQSGKIPAEGKLNPFKQD